MICSLSLKRRLNSSGFAPAVAGPPAGSRFIRIRKEFSLVPRKYSELSMSDWIRYRPRPRSLSESGNSARDGHSKPEV